jgi:hypothetical protein
MRLADIGQKIKSFSHIHRKGIDSVLFVGILLLLIYLFQGVLAYRDHEAARMASLQIQVPNQAKEQGSNQASGAFVASTGGNVYYRSDCPGVNAIQDDHKIWFVSAKDAEAAGFSISKKCAL